LIVFDDVLIPWEDVIFSREPELAALMRSEFARWAAQGYLTRSLAKADILVGAALLYAEQVGSANVPAVRSKISQLMVFKQTIESFLIAAETACQPSRCGFAMPNQAIQNAGRIYCSQTYGDMVQHLREIVGGQPVMLPDHAMLDSADIGPDVRKYFCTGDGVERLRVMHLARELTSSAYAGRVQAYQLFAETPVFAQEAALYATYDRAGSLGRARRLAGLDQEPK
jgi:4-hydroxyphenylacetate 3-monooxygenase